jgi:hypothetical protein
MNTRHQESRRAGINLRPSTHPTTKGEGRRSEPCAWRKPWAISASVLDAPYTVDEAAARAQAATVAGLPVDERISGA